MADITIPPAALEEAAKVAEIMNSHGAFIAAAIRALKGKP